MLVCLILLFHLCRVLFHCFFFHGFFLVVCFWGAWGTEHFFPFFTVNIHVPNPYRIPWLTAGSAADLGDETRDGDGFHAEMERKLRMVW